MTGEVEERKSMRGDDEGHIIMVSDVRWHDCREEQPCWEGVYLTVLRRGELLIAEYSDERWRDIPYNRKAKNITHDVEYWAELPETPGW